MKRREIIRRCRLESCNKELPPRYKGREKEYCSPECRKIWHLENPN